MQNNNKPLFTVIVPTHNRSRLLSRALTSLISQDNESEMEIIVVSDSKNSDTDAVCDKLLRSSDTYVRRSGLNGPSESRNIGLDLAKGNYILFLDDDDAWNPGCLRSLIYYQNHYYMNPGYFNCSVVKERRLPEGPIYISEQALDLAGHLTPQVYVKNQIHMSCFIFPAWLIKGIKFDPTMRAYEDWDFLLSIFDVSFPKHLPFLGSKVYEVEDETTDRRGSSQSANDFNAVMDYIYVYRRHKSPDKDIQRLRQLLIENTGLSIPLEMF